MTATTKQLNQWAERLRKGASVLKDKHPRASISLSEIAAEMEKAAKPTKKRFTAPELKEWIAYAKTLSPPFDTLEAEGAFCHYEANGWMVGKNKMKDWKAACRTCHKTWVQRTPGVAKGASGSISSLRARLKHFTDRRQGPHTEWYEFCNEKEIAEAQEIIKKIKELEQ